VSAKFASAAKSLPISTILPADGLMQIAHSLRPRVFFFQRILFFAGFFLLALMTSSRAFGKKKTYMGRAPATKSINADALGRMTATRVGFLGATWLSLCVQRGV